MKSKQHIVEALTFLRSLFPETGGDIFLVGGSVRDFLLGRQSQDFDLLAGVPAEGLRKCGFRLVEGKTTAPIFFRHEPPYGKIEVTLLPEEVPLEEELRGRDFTINAIAMRLSGEILDPLGGETDLRSGLLRVCSPQAFEHDPVRIFRGFRFESEGMRLSAESCALIKERDWSEALPKIPCERLSRELLKALAGKEPGRFFYRMLEFGVGKEWLPELFRMPVVPAGPPKYHPEGDVLAHSMSALEAATAATGDPLARFCAFFHDLGKLATDPACYPKHHGHDAAGARMAVDFCNRLCLPASYRKALAAVCRLHMHMNRWDELRPSTKLRVAEQTVTAGVADILPVVASSDRRGSEPPTEWPRVVQVARMSARQLGIDMEVLGRMQPSMRPSFLLQRKVELLKSGLS